MPNVVRMNQVSYLIFTIQESRIQDLAITPVQSNRVKKKEDLVNSDHNFA